MADFNGGLQCLKKPERGRRMLSIGSVDDWIYTETGGVVQSGPFAGMQLGRERAWASGSLSPTLLGCYEQELHQEIEKEIKRLAKLPTAKIVNVGCAEGYYAIGLARRLPQATVWAIDTNDAALRIAHAMAAANGVKLITGAVLEEVFAAPDLVVMDCEGAELHYLDPEHFPGLLRSHIIVELHPQTDGADVVQVLFDRWKPHHHILLVAEGARNPNQFRLLWDKPSSFRWAAMCENRPCMMLWFVMWPR